METLTLSQVVLTKLYKLNRKFFRLGFLDKLDKFYRDNFVSHETKYKEQHSKYAVNLMNKIFHNEYEPYLLPPKLVVNLKELPVDSPLQSLEGLKLNFPALCEVLCVITMATEFMGVGDAKKDLLEKLSNKIVEGADKFIDKKKVVSSLELSLKHLKQLYKTDEFPNFLNLYNSAMDVETDNTYDSVFSVFYAVEGFTSLISLHFGSLLDELVSAELEQFNNRKFRSLNDIFNERRVSKLETRSDYSRSLKESHLNFLNEDINSGNWEPLNMLNIIELIAINSGMDSDAARRYSNGLKEKVNKEIPNLDHLIKLNTSFSQWNSLDSITLMSRMEESYGNVIKSCYKPE